MSYGQAARTPPAPSPGQFRDKLTQLLKGGYSRTADFAAQRDALATATALMQQGEEAAAFTAHLIDILLGLRQPAGQPNTAPASSAKAHSGRDRDDLIIEILADKNWDHREWGMKARVMREFERRHPKIPIDYRTVAYALQVFELTIDLYDVREEILKETRWDLKAPDTRQLLVAEIQKRYPEIELRVIGTALTRLERGDEDAPVRDTGDGED
jgi:hypothetical protein